MRSMGAAVLRDRGQLRSNRWSQRTVWVADLVALRYRRFACWSCWRAASARGLCWRSHSARCDWTTWYVGPLARWSLLSRDLPLIASGPEGNTREPRSSASGFSGRVSVPRSAAWRWHALARIARVPPRPSRSESLQPSGTSSGAVAPGFAKLFAMST